MESRIRIVLSILLLIAAQCVFAVHELEHIAEPFDDNEFCELCLTAAGIDQANAVAVTGGYGYNAAVSPVLLGSTDHFHAFTFYRASPRGPPPHANAWTF